MIIYKICVILWYILCQILEVKSVEVIYLIYGVKFVINVSLNYVNFVKKLVLLVCIYSMLVVFIFMVRVI